MRTNKLTQAFIQGKLLNLDNHQSKLNALIKEIQSIVMGIFNAILGNASEVTIEKVSKEFEPILIDGEQIEKAYKVIRDMFILQTKK
jgi:hypothetical protein